MWYRCIYELQEILFNFYMIVQYFIRYVDNLNKNFIVFFLFVLIRHKHYICFDLYVLNYFFLRLSVHLENLILNEIWPFLKDVVHRQHLVQLKDSWTFVGSLANIWGWFTYQNVFLDFLFENCFENFSVNLLFVTVVLLEYFFWYLVLENDFFILDKQYSLL